PIPVQFVFYTFIGGLSAIVNLACFVGLLEVGVGLTPAALSAFFIAAFVNYYLSVKLVFRHKAKWTTVTEGLIYLGVVVAVGLIDLYSTRFFVAIGLGPALAKLLSTGLDLVFNFVGRRFIVFPEKGNPDWNPQVRS